MTDGERFKSDKDLRQKYDDAIADLSRLRQQAAAIGERFVGLGQTLKAVPQNIHIRQQHKTPPVSPEWRWTFTPPTMEQLMEVSLPEWGELINLVNEIQRLTIEAPRLHEELKKRRLIE